MFISDTHLPQILAPEAYVSQEQYEREMERLFCPGWHFIGALDDIPNEGDFFTYELFGHPLIVWRSEGTAHTFLNVCAHRFSTLRDAPCGHMDKLHCQYHGWEYDCNGDTKRIPDAKSFRPMEKGKLGLKKFRTELCGQGIYVNLTDEGPGLEEYLGKGYEVARTLLSADRPVFLSVDYDVDSNWKVKIENTLESYHIDLIHPKTFGTAPDERICKHVLDPTYTTFSTTDPGPSKVAQLFNKVTHRVAGVKYDTEYKHHLYYPSIMMMQTGLFSVAESVFPQGPNKSKVRMKFFCNVGDRNSLKGRILFRQLRRFAGPFFRKVAQEDASIMPSIQRGLLSKSHPSEGLISIREERLFHFQEFIRKATMEDDGESVTEPSNGVHHTAAAQS